MLDDKDLPISGRNLSDFEVKRIAISVAKLVEEMEEIYDIHHVEAATELFSAIVGMIVCESLCPNEDPEGESVGSYLKHGVDSAIAEVLRLQNNETPGIKPTLN